MFARVLEQLIRRHEIVTANLKPTAKRVAWPHSNNAKSRDEDALLLHIDDIFKGLLYIAAKLIMSTELSQITNGT